MFKKIVMILQDYGKQLSRDNITSFASSTAFFFFLSLVPMLMIVCSVLPFTPLTEENLMTAVTSIMPDTMDPLMISMIRQIYDRTSGILPIAIIVTIWSAGKGMLALMRGLNVVNGVVENRNYFVLRIEASFYTVLTLIAVLLSLGFSVFGKVVVHTISNFVPQIGGLIAGVVHLRFLFVWIFLTIAFAVIYTFIPNKKLKLRYQIPGATFTSIAWTVFSYCFSIYVDDFNGMSAYGSLSTIALIMVWMYFCIYLLLIGANMNRYFKPVIKVLMNSNRK
ncbi:MAG: YihY/virulence factor BrkB family protein [Lachnospiraceae bacterium]|nr:YihY/virulence factor BrkB family protein [Lachnospiraceae bacterium]